MSNDSAPSAPTVSEHFNAAASGESATNAQSNAQSHGGQPVSEYEARQERDTRAKEELKRLEESRAKPAPGMHLTPGGTVEQSVNTQVEAQNESRIAKLKQRMKDEKERQQQENAKNLSDEFNQNAKSLTHEFNRTR